MRRSASEIIRNLESRIASLESKTARWRASYTITHKLMSESDGLIATWKDKAELTGVNAEDAINQSFEGIDHIEVEIQRPSSIFIEQDRGNDYSWGVEEHFSEDELDASDYLETTLTFKGLSHHELSHIVHLLESDF